MECELPDDFSQAPNENQEPKHRAKRFEKLIFPRKERCVNTLNLTDKANTDKTVEAVIEISTIKEMSASM